MGGERGRVFDMDRGGWEEREGGYLIWTREDGRRHRGRVFNMDRGG